MDGSPEVLEGGQAPPGPPLPRPMTVIGCAAARPTGSSAVKRPDSPLLRPIAARSVQMKRGQLELGQVR